MLTKKQIEDFKKLEGDVRGMAIKVDLDFVFEEKGKEGIQKVEKALARAGFPIEYKKIKPMEFYPISLSAVLLTTIKETFNFNEKDLERWGASVVKFSMLMKIFMKYFASLDLVTKQIPNIWRKHYTIGELEVFDYSEKKKFVILRLKNFKVHPVHCHIYKGYFSKTTEMIVKKKIKCEETKCMFKGDPYHEFLLTW